MVVHIGASIAESANPAVPSTNSSHVVSTGLPVAGADATGQSAAPTPRGASHRTSSSGSGANAAQGSLGSGGSSGGTGGSGETGSPGGTGNLGNPGSGG